MRKVNVKPLKIISGAQTGVDRAALDAAIARGLDYGGSLPRGRLAEDGPVARRYTRLNELKQKDYAARTRRNVLDADATLILCPGEPEGGTALTVRLARAHSRPVLVVDIDNRDEKTALELMRAWIAEQQPRVLNIAGPRESSFPGLYARVRSMLEQLFADCVEKS